jgi:hypothetical protein
MAMPNSSRTIGNPGRTARRGVVLATGAVLSALVAGCVPPDGLHGTPHPDRTAPSPWIVDHLEHRARPGDPSPTAYTAYCAPAADYNPAHVPGPDELTPVPISAADYTRLQVGDRCPAQPPATR